MIRSADNTRSGTLATVLGVGTLIERFGLTALEDQQLAGLIMWIPACSV